MHSKRVAFRGWKVVRNLDIHQQPAAVEFRTLAFCRLFRNQNGLGVGTSHIVNLNKDECSSEVRRRAAKIDGAANFDGRLLGHPRPS